MEEHARNTQVPGLCAAVSPIIPPIFPFLRTVLRRPDLAAFVHWLTFLGDCYRISPLAPRADLEKVSDVVKRMDVSYGQHWSRELRMGTINACFALLLSRCPNITSLPLRLDFRTISLFVGIVLRSAGSKSTASTTPETTFPALRTPQYEHLESVCFQHSGLRASPRKA